jgi:AraC-like DNA-binding protein
MINPPDLLTQTSKNGKIEPKFLLNSLRGGNMDILSDTLQVVRLTGAIFFDARLSSPWAFYSAPADELRSRLHSSSECLTLFHILDKGECWVTIKGHVSFLMREGDAVVFPHGSPHIVSSLQKPEPATIQPTPIDELLQLGKHGIASITAGGNGTPSRFICGYLQCDQRFNPLVGAMPTVVWLRRSTHSESPLIVEDGEFPPWCIVTLEKGQWLETTLQHTIQELNSGNPGNTAMLARLWEIMFVEVLRRYMQQLPEEYEGWLSAVKDRRIGQVLQLMHAEPNRAWTVEDLAEAAAVSRSTLAQRFTALIGETPMQYLTGWRMQLAKNLLRQTNLTIPEIASRTGYTSEVSFNHAFKRNVGQPPVMWRKGAEQSLKGGSERS